MTNDMKTPEATEMIAIKNLTLRLPQTEKTLIENLNLTINKGDRIIISGASGSGKSTIVRAIRDLWDAGSGEVVLPSDAKVIVASQKAYAPNSTLPAVMCAPLPAGTYSNAQIADALRAVGRGNMIQYLPGQTTAAIVSLLKQTGATDIAVMKAEATRIIRENVSNLQTVTAEEQAGIVALVGGDTAKAEELVTHLEQEYARNIAGRLAGWMVPGLVASYANGAGHIAPDQARFIEWRLSRTLESNMTRAIKKMQHPRWAKHADWMGGEKPSARQIAYIAQTMNASIAEGIKAQSKTANSGLNGIGQLFALAAGTMRLPGVLIRGAAFPFNWAAREYTLAKPLALVGGALWLASKPFDVAANLTLDLVANPLRRPDEFKNPLLRGVSSLFNKVAFVMALPRMNNLVKRTGIGRYSISDAMNGELSQEIFTGRTLSNRLSGGEQQRIIFARALLHQPDILILDEVTAALDKPAAQKLYDDLVKALPDTTIISVAHNEHVIPYHTKHGHLENKTLTVTPVLKPQ